VQAWESGFGYVVDMQLVRDRGDLITGVAEYLSKPASEVTEAELQRFAASRIDPHAAYVSGLSKTLAASAMTGRFRESGARRVRPYRASRNWPGGGLTKEEERIRAEQAGRRIRSDAQSPAEGWRCWTERDLWPART
jgi:hypothetical protein